MRAIEIRLNNNEILHVNDSSKLYVNYEVVPAGMVLHTGQGLEYLYPWHRIQEVIKYPSNGENPEETD